MAAKYDLMDALSAIPPDVPYDEHIAVGAALHHEGYGIDAWRSWTDGCTQADHAHRMRELEKHWKSFGNQSGSPVTGGTLVKLARDHGWEPKPRYEDLDWDVVFYGDEDDDAPIVDASTVSEYDAEVKPMYEDGHECEELAAYIRALFDEADIIRYVLDGAFDEEKCKYNPGVGTYRRTAGDVLAALAKVKRLDDALGTMDADMGAYIAINPLDGSYIGNKNVTDFRHALVESDDMEIGKFAAIVREMNLPVAAMVYSGNKSLHAVVKVNAATPEQYAARVRVLYERCEKNGIAIDHANKNASRMSRLPGAMRGGQRQFLAGLAQGARDWDEWEDWYTRATDDLPDVESLEEAFTNPEELNPELIEGVLRVGHKMLLSGPSKAGKSFALLTLAIAFAEGWEWMGMRCRQARVLYMNLEVDRKSFKKRFADVYGEIERTTGRHHENAGAVYSWNLRGKAKPMIKLLPALVRRAMEHDVDVVIIDPIYKVMMGDENSAGDMAAFANVFDALCDQAGVSVIYCHHHSKGYQGAKRAIDRASGSGVFGRDPDAILDMTELDVDSGDRWKHTNDAVCAECARAVAAAGHAAMWDELPAVTRTVEANAIDAAIGMLTDEQAIELGARTNAIKERKDTVKAWRISSTLREFAEHRPIDVWFDWPLFTIDETLKDIAEIGAEDPKKQKKGRRVWSEEDSKKAVEAHQRKSDSEHALIAPAILAAYNACIEDGVEKVTVNELYDRFPDIDELPYPVTLNKVKEWTKERNPWCPVVKTDRKADDGKSSVLGLRGENGSCGENG